MPEQYKRHPNTSCSICKKPIYKRPGLIKENNGKIFCSTTCYGISCRKEKPCAMCGKLILAGLNKKTCSRSCANTYRIGIKYKLGRPKDRANSLRALKMRLLEIRGKKCERCNYDMFEILQVHHRDRDRGNNDLKNLEVVCPNCHYKEHYFEKSWLRR